MKMETEAFLFLLDSQFLHFHGEAALHQSLTKQVFLKALQN